MSDWSDKIVSGMTMVADGLEEGIQEWARQLNKGIRRITDQLNVKQRLEPELHLVLAYNRGLVNGRVYWLAHHGSPRVRKKQYARARRLWRKRN